MTSGPAWLAAQPRIRRRFLANDWKCQMMIESREKACRKLSVLPLQIWRRSTARSTVRRISRASERQRE